MYKRGVVLVEQSGLFSLFEKKDSTKKRIRYKEPSYLKENSIKEQIKKDNSELHVFRYTTLYRIYNKLYLLTFQKPLAVLNYYIEDDGSLFAEIKGSEHLNLYIKDRVLLHVDLLRKIKNNDPTLEYVQKKEIKTKNAQLSLFS